MLMSTHMRDEAQDMLVHKWQELTRSRGTSRCSGVHEQCPVVWVLDDLLDLMAEFHDRPVVELRPMIRRLIHEKTCLDNMEPSQHSQSIDKQVDLAVDVLESIRRQGLDNGQWSDQPSTPLMFG